MIIPMVYIFRSGITEIHTFSFRSWGILGTIGWGYLVAALVYMGVRDNLVKNCRSPSVLPDDEYIIKTSSA